MPFVEVGPGIDVFAEDWGQGRPIVFVHGNKQSHRVFEFQMLKLAQQGYRVIGIDLRGFGVSDKPWEGNDYDTWADDIGKVVEHLDLNDVTLVGFSSGGAVAAHYVATHDDPRVSKLVLLDAVAPSGAPDEQSKQFMNGLIQADFADQAKFTNEFLKGLFNTPLSPEYLQWQVNIGMQGSLRASVRWFEELRDRDLSSELGNITIPTLICHGMHDKMVPFAAAQAQQQMIRNATLVPFENSGHAVFWDEKDKLTDELMRFASGRAEAAA